MKKTIILISILLLFFNLNPVQITIADNKKISLKESFEKSPVIISNGNILYVGGSGPGNYSSIQSAIDGASSGDFVFVYSGTYLENIIIEKSITLQGQEMNSTYINGDGNYNTVYINSDSVTLSDFTIENSEIGVVLETSSDNNIKTNTIKNMDVSIWLYDSINNQITYNNLNNNLVGMELLSSSDYNLVSNNKIHDNVFGIMLYSSSHNDIKNNTIKQNDESGIWLNYLSNSNEISNNSIESNSNGIEIFTSLSNTIFQNYITNQNIGIFLDIDSNGNNIFQNNFIENYNNAYSIGDNFWDDGEYGNFWSDYEDKYPNAHPKLFTPWIWDTSYEIDEDNIDNYPLVNQWPKPVSNSNCNYFIFKYQLIKYFIEKYPNAFPILRQIIGY